jgi:hypothetical protein
MLLGCHSMLAMWTSSPEMELDEKEAKELSNAIQRVSKFYTQTVDPKKLAWANLIFVAGGIYGTRYAAISNRKSKEKPARAPAPIPLKHPTVKEVNEEKNMPITNPSQLWPQSGGVDGEITEG